MPAQKTSATVNKFTVWGVVVLIAAIALTALAISTSDLELFGMTALPLGLLSAGLFYRNHLNQR